MPNKIFTEKTDKKVESIVASIKLLTIVGGEPGDEPGRAVDEEINLSWGNQKGAALACVFLWARMNGMPVEKPALDSLIKTLQEQAPMFEPRRKTPVVRGRRKGGIGDFARLVRPLLRKNVPKDEIYTNHMES
jgi:hypothetical protein